MKVEGRKEDTKKFAPVSLTITLETAQEFDMFYCIFNHTLITEVVSKCGIDHGEIRNTLRKTTLCNGNEHLEYSIAFGMLDKHLREKKC